MKLGPQDIDSVEDLAMLSDYDYKQLGFSVGVKSKIK